MYLNVKDNVSLYISEKQILNTFKKKQTTDLFQITWKDKLQSFFFKKDTISSKKALQAQWEAIKAKHQNTTYLEFQLIQFLNTRSSNPLILRQNTQHDVYEVMFNNKVIKHIVITEELSKKKITKKFNLSILSQQNYIKKQNHQALSITANDALYCLSTAQPFTTFKKIRYRNLSLFNKIYEKLFTNNDVFKEYHQKLTDAYYYYSNPSQLTDLNGQHFYFNQLAKHLSNKDPFISKWFYNLNIIKDTIEETNYFPPVLYRFLSLKQLTYVQEHIAQFIPPMIEKQTPFIKVDITLIQLIQTLSEFTHTKHLMNKENELKTILSYLNEETTPKQWQTIKTILCDNDTPSVQSEINTIVLRLKQLQTEQEFYYQQYSDRNNKALDFIYAFLDKPKQILKIIHDPKYQQFIIHHRSEILKYVIENKIPFNSTLMSLICNEEILSADYYTVFEHGMKNPDKITHQYIEYLYIQLYAKKNIGLKYYPQLIKKYPNFIFLFLFHSNKNAYLLFNRTCEMLHNNTNHIAEHYAVHAEAFQDYIMDNIKSMSITQFTALYDNDAFLHFDDKMLIQFLIKNKQSSLHADKKIQFITEKNEALTKDTSNNTLNHIMNSDIIKDTKIETILHLLQKYNGTQDEKEKYLNDYLQRLSQVIDQNRLSNVALAQKYIIEPARIKKEKDSKNLFTYKKTPTITDEQYLTIYHNIDVLANLQTDSALADQRLNLYIRIKKAIHPHIIDIKNKAHAENVLQKIAEDRPADEAQFNQYLIDYLANNQINETNEKIDFEKILLNKNVCQNLKLNSILLSIIKSEYYDKHILNSRDNVANIVKMLFDLPYNLFTVLLRKPQLKQYIESMPQIEIEEYIQKNIHQDNIHFMTEFFNHYTDPSKLLSFIYLNDTQYEYQKEKNHLIKKAFMKKKH